MENKKEYTAKGNRDVKIDVISGHFVTKHSHVNHCIDMTRIKSELSGAKETAALFAEAYKFTPVDTIITLEHTKMLGAFLSEQLSRSGINERQNIAVISPEISNEQMILRDNLAPYIRNKRILLVTATATTGLTIAGALEGIWYYGGTPVGVATVFGGAFGDKVNVHGICDVPIVRLFRAEDIPEYASYPSAECPLCKAGKKIDALINSYGYSKI